MKYSILADTGPLYAAVDRDDQYHQRAHDELRAIAEAGAEVIVAYPTILEAYTLVLYRLGKRVASGWLAELRAGVALINPIVEDYRQASHKASGYRDQSITLFDATVAVIAERMALPVWTYDHHFDTMRTPVWRR